VATCKESHKFFLDKEVDQADAHSFLDLLMFYATHDELGNNPEFMGEGNTTDFKPLFTTRDEDVEFKKLLWTGILYIVRDPENEAAHLAI